MHVHLKPASHLRDVEEAVRVEQLLVQVGVEDFDLAIPLLVLCDDRIDAHLREQRGEARDAPP